MSQAAIRAHVRSLDGQPYNADAVAQAQRRLVRTGKFLVVTPTFAVDEGEVIVTFTVTEKPQTQAIDFEGNVKYKRKDLLDELDFIAGDPLDRFAIDQGRDNIERRYREDGYFFAEVTVDEALLERDRRVLYTIVEGPRVKVRKILFEGNHSIGRRELRGKITTAPYIWIFRTGEFDVDRLAQDEIALRDHYRRRGFLDAQVTHRLEFSDDREDLTIVFQMLEGTQYKLRAIHFEGNTVFTDDELAAVVGLAPGMVIDGDRLEADQKALRTQYGENGYIDARIVAEDPIYLEDEPDQIELTFRITEGTQVTVGLIEVVGNEGTKDKVVRRELRFFPGEIYDSTKIEESKRALVETRLFTEESTVEPIGADTPIRDARVTVVEGKAGEIRFGAGVSSESGLVGDIRWSLRNFDLFDWPRTAAELFKGQAFRGAGQSASIEFQPSTEFTRFHVRFREPYLMDQRLTLGTDFFLFQRQRDAYEEKRAGIDIWLRKTIEKGWLEGWAREVGIRVEGIGIDGVNFFDAPDIRDVEGSSFLTAVRGALIHDTTDSFFFPTRGHRITLSYEQIGAMGGDFFFGKAEARYVWHKTLRVDRFERKSVLSLRGQAGAIVGDAPVFERFYAGGPSSLRGFGFRGVSPRDGLFRDRVGGDFRLLTGAQYNFPVVSDWLRGVVFTDMGTVEETFGRFSWRSSVGFGLRLNVPFLGPAPMVFDFAFPVTKDSEDDTRIFSFSFLTTF